MPPVFPEVCGIDNNGFDYQARRSASQYGGGVQEFANDVGRVNPVGAIIKFDRTFTKAELDSVTDFLDARQGWQPFGFSFDGRSQNTIVVTCPGGYDVKAIGDDLWSFSAILQRHFGSEN